MVLLTLANYWLSFSVFMAKTLIIFQQEYPVALEITFIKPIKSGSILHVLFLLSVEDPHDLDNDVGKNSFRILLIRRSFENAYFHLSRNLNREASAPTILSRIVCNDESLTSYRAYIEHMYRSKEPVILPEDDSPMFAVVDIPNINTTADSQLLKTKDVNTTVSIHKKRKISESFDKKHRKRRYRTSDD